MTASSITSESSYVSDEWVEETPDTMFYESETEESVWSDDDEEIEHVCCEACRHYQEYLDKEYEIETMEFEIRDASTMWKPSRRPVLQSGISLMDYIKSQIAKQVINHVITPEVVNSAVKKVCHYYEVMILTIMDFRRCVDFCDVYYTVMRLIKMLSHDTLWDSIKNGSSWVMEQLRSFKDSVCGLQSGVSDNFEYILSGARSLFDKTKDIRNSPAVKKLQTLFSYFLTFGLFKSFGLTFDRFKISDFRRRSMEKSYSSLEGFVTTTIETVLWFLERGMQAVKLGSFSPFLHSAASYQKWADEAYQLQEDVLKMACPSAHGFDEHSFRARLEDCVKQGEEMLKFLPKDKHDGVDESLQVKRLLHEVRMIQIKINSKDYAQRDRPVPCSWLIHGDSKVAKSMFKEIMFQHYGKIHDKDISPDCCWTLNPADKFFSGYKTSKWCICIDDLAQFSPNLKTLDPTVGFVICIVNGIAFTAPMADLEDKGTIPVRPDLVLATTNTKEMNAHVYFSYPLAVQRRFPYVVTVTVKDEFKRDGMLDENLIPIVEGEYQDIWNIEVSKVIAVPTMKEHQSTSGFQPVASFEHIYDFLGFYGELTKQHWLAQMKCAAAVERYRAIGVCKGCLRPEYQCSCPIEVVVQSGECPLDIEEAMSRPYDHNLRRMVNHWTRGFSQADVAEAHRLAPIDTYECFEFCAKVNNELEADLEVIFPDDWNVNDRDWNTWANETYDSNLEILCANAKICAMGIKSGVQYASAKTTETFKELVDAYRIVRIRNAITGKLEIVREWTQKLYQLGEKMYNSTAIPIVAGFVAIAGMIWTAWKLASSFVGMFTEFGGEHTLAGDHGEGQPCLQGNVLESVNQPKDEKANCWQRDEIVLSEFHVGEAARGLASLTPDEVMKIVQRGTVNIRAHCPDEEVMVPGTALGIKGHVYVTCNHCLPYSNRIRMEVSCQPITNSTSPNITYSMGQKDIIRFPEMDIAFFYCPLPPKKDLTTWFMKSHCPALVCNGAYAHCRYGMFPERNDVRCICTNTAEIPLTQPLTLKGWQGFPTKPTVFGDCGSPLVGWTPLGPVIMGLHQVLFEDGSTQACMFWKEQVDAALEYFGHQVSEGEPRLKDPIGPLHQKSVLRWAENGTGQIYGTTVGKTFRPAPKSRVCDTIMCEAAKEEGFEQKTGAPVMKGPEVWNLNVEPTVLQSFEMLPHKIKQIVEMRAEYIFAHLSEEDKLTLRPLSDKAALNGIPGVKFIDKINRNTSMGYPHRKSKRNFLVELPPDATYQDAVEFTEEVMDEVAWIKDMYRRNERVMPVFVATLKDEAVPFEKIEIKKTRAFLGGSASHQFVMRQYLLPFVRVFQKNPILFEGAPGVNCNSCSWRKFYRFLTKHGKNRIIAGDYSKFDKRMEPVVILMAFYFIYLIHKMSGADEEHLQFIMCIAEDIAYPLCNIQEDWIMFFGSNPSGQALTVIINCIANSIYIRVAWMDLGGNLEEFPEKVSLITYGDDNAMGVAEGFDWFNHTAISKALAEYGVVYTMADKHAASVPFLHISQITFLKRRFVERMDGRVECPLEWASIEKMLTTWVPSRTVCPEAQAVSVLSSAQAEMFQYGKQVFEEGTERLRRIAKKSNLEHFVTPTTFRSYQELEQRYWDACDEEECSECSEHSAKCAETDCSSQCDLL